jgi:hypothetical protein
MTIDFDRIKGIALRGIRRATVFLGLGVSEIYFTTINQARNCITHRQGRVGKEDLKGSDSFTPTWRAFDIIIQTPDGAENLPAS